MAQIGKCTNNVGCTLAYTGQEIRFEGSAVCPECGRPLTLLAKPKTGSKLRLVLLALVVLVACAVGAFLGVDGMRTGPVSTKASPAAPAPQVATNTSDGKMVDG